MEKIIVTGANGYLGRNFIKYVITQGIEVYAVDINHDNSIFRNSNLVHFVNCSMATIDLLLKLIPQQEYFAFYHFAWNGVAGDHVNRKNYASQIDNIKYSCDAAIISKKLGCKKFITTGSIVEKATREFSESAKITESYYYGIAKESYHKYLEVISKIYEINYIWVILPNIYGGDSRTIISYMLKEFKENRIPSFGSCDQFYNFTYIKDIVSGLLFLGVNNTKCGEYFLSNGECRRMFSYLEEIANYLNKEIVIGAREDDGLNFKKEWFDNHKVIELGFQPQYSLISGVIELYTEIMEG